METDEAPWAAAGRSYAGWVPNVRSHLSFSLIGAARRADAFTQSYSGKPVRLVLVYQERISNDLPWPDLWVRRTRPDLVHEWVMEARTKSTLAPLLTRESAAEAPGASLPTHVDRQGMLLGRVHVLPYQVDVEPGERQQAAVAEIRELIARAPAVFDDAELDDLQSSVVAKLRQGSLNRAELSFALMRTGEVRLWYEGEDVPFNDERKLFELAEQAYFFIKDVVHDHAHHDPTSDQITPLVRMRGVDAEPDHGDELAWRRETLWSLSREVERLHRQGGLVSQRRSLGIIAYAEAFQTYLMGHVRTTTGSMSFEASTNLHDYDFKHLRDSVGASIDVASTKQSQIVQMIVGGVGVAISTSSLCVALVSAHNAYSRAVDEPVRNLAGMEVPSGAVRIAVTNPLLVGVATAMIFIMVIVYNLADGEGGLFNRAQRVLSQLSRAAANSLAKTDAAAFLWDMAFHVVLVAASIAVTGGMLLLMAAAA